MGHIGALLQPHWRAAQKLGVGAHRINHQMNSDSEEEAALVYFQRRSGRPPLKETLKGSRLGSRAVASRLRVPVNDLDEDGWSLLLWASGGEILTEEHVEFAPAT